MNIILVDEQDNELGFAEKMEVHQKGLLHRAFSIFIFNDKNELLIQQRSKTKYHSPLLWTNTCCGHPLPDEKTAAAAKRRLKEEMGINCELKKIFDFIYNVKFDNDLIENEFDHVFIGKFNRNPIPNQKEIEKYKWINLGELKKDMKENPDKYTYWFKICLDKVISLNK